MADAGIAGAGVDDVAQFRPESLQLGELRFDLRQMAACDGVHFLARPGRIARRQGHQLLHIVEGESQFARTAQEPHAFDIG